MDKKIFESALQDLFSKVKKRNFDESVDLIITFKNLSLKNKDHRFDYFVTIPNPYITKIKTLAFVKNKQFLESLKGIVDKVILDEDISKMSKKEKKKLANEFDLILAEGPAMLTVGKFLGQALSPRGKMPTIMPPNEQAVKNLISSQFSKLKVSNKKSKTSLSIMLKVGKRSQEVSKISENTLVVYNSLLEKLPNGKQNIKDVVYKTTMSAPVKVGGAL
jgi:large subunit ribosomal protein L1